MNSISDLIIQHENKRTKTLNMIASENLLSPMTRLVMLSDLTGRYTVSQLGQRLFPGLQSFDEIDYFVKSSLQQSLYASFVNTDLLSGMQANMAAYHALISPGDLVLTLEERNGGHYSHKKGNSDIRNKAKSMLDFFGAKVEELPFDVATYNIDINKAKEVILDKKPKLIIVGASEILFPIPLSQLHETCLQTGTKILYDASHVAGLIIGGQFQNPFKEGADMISSSTNKTLAGPSHGFVASNNNSDFRLVVDATNSLITSNQQAHHLAGLAITLSEFEQFGKEYATQITKNSQTLGQSLFNHGIKVIAHENGFSQTHMILVDTKTIAQECVNNLADSGIIVSGCPMPHDSEEQTGLRIGTQEITRLGMSEKEMKYIGELISSILLKKDSPSKVEQKVEELRAMFMRPKYCFEVDTEFLEFMLEKCIF